jgi:hypothetical protein
MYFKDESIDDSEVDLIRKRFEIAQDYWTKQFDQSKEDLLFCNPDCQWGEDVKAKRNGRPTYASDRLNAQVKNLTNSQRENRPGITVDPCGDGADEETARVIQGLFRHIEQRSKGDLAYDCSFEDCVRMGLGIWRILTQYEDDNSFDQEIIISPITNIFNCLPDPYFKSPDGSDMEDFFIYEAMSREEFMNAYPNARVVTWGPGDWTTTNCSWINNSDKSIIVAEYWHKTFESRTMVRLQDGTIKDKADCSKDELQLIVQSREVEVPKIECLKLNGDEILERTDWMGKYIPFVICFGDRLLDVNTNKTIYSGLVRKCREEQTMLNVAKSTAVELIAAMPKTPWVGATGFTASHKADWQDINTKNLAYIEYDIVDDQGNELPPPQRNVQDVPIQGIMGFMESIENDIKATNSMYDPNLGEKVSNQSGIAIKSLQQQGSITNFHYSDNLARAIRLTGEIIMDLIPKIYSEKRVVRIIGLDDKAELVTLNDPDALDGVYDLSKGRYEVAVTSGPSYLTRRQENLNKMIEMVKSDPNLMTTHADLIFSQMDFPMKQAFVERSVAALPPQLKPIPKDGPDPAQQIQTLSQQLDQAHQMIQQLSLTLQKETQLANTEQTKLQIAQLNAQTEMVKQKRSEDHDAALALMKAHLESAKLTEQHVHDLISTYQQHSLGKEKSIHDAVVGAMATPPATDNSQNTAESA